MSTISLTSQKAYFDKHFLEFYPQDGGENQLADMERNYVTVTLCIAVWLGSTVVSVLDLGAEGPGFKSQPRRCRVTVLGKLFTPIVPLFTKQRN